MEKSFQYTFQIYSFSKKIPKTYLDLKKSINELVLKPTTNRDPNIEKLINADKKQH